MGDFWWEIREEQRDRAVPRKIFPQSGAGKNYIGRNGIG